MGCICSSVCADAIRSFCSFFKFHRLVQSIYWSWACVSLRLRRVGTGGRRLCAGTRKCVEKLADIIIYYRLSFSPGSRLSLVSHYVRRISGTFLLDFICCSRTDSGIRVSLYKYMRLRRFLKTHMRPGVPLSKISYND